MASVSEQLLANLSWQAWRQASDLHKRIWFTLGVFIIYRLGTYIPLPGINPVEMKLVASQYTRGFFGIFNMVSGGALERMTIFALNLMPYISASIIVQLMTAIFPHFEALKKQGESGRRKISQYTRYGTVALASVQSVGVASFLLTYYPNVVLDPGIFFYLTTIVTIIGSTLFLMWLSEQITARGVGNGSSMIIYAGIVASLPQSIFQTLELSRTGGISSIEILSTIVGAGLIIAFIVFMERAYRKVVVQYPKRQVGTQLYSGEQSYMPIKLNSTGVLPPIFAFALLGFLRFFSAAPFLDKVPFLKSFSQSLQEGGWVGLGVQVSLIVFFAFFYTSIVFNPEETADNLRKNGAFIPGYRPGTMTSNYLMYLLNRLTMIGAIYIAFVVILPALLNKIFNLNFPFQGTSFLITVSVSLEIISQVHSYLISHQYSTLLKRQKGKSVMGPLR